MRRGHAVGWSMGVAVLSALSSYSCAPPPRMCAQESDCGSQASCVAGRCVVHGATASIDNARRFLVDPIDVGWVQHSGGSPKPSVATFGRDGDAGIAFLRFSLELRPDLKIIEAYLLLARASDYDADPSPVSLHAARVVSAWDSRSLSWGHQPRLEEVGAPVTLLAPGSGPLVRIDVRDIVQRWRRRDPSDLGLALVADGHSDTGIAFALGPTDVESTREDSLALSRAPAPTQSFSPFEPRAAMSTPEARRSIPGPRLEVYAR